MIKQLEEIKGEQIEEAFERQDLVVFTDPADFKTYLFSQDYENTCLLLMSSGNYGGLDFGEVKGYVEKT
jgi:UDP-N-acetylmuramate: L-alanyl-gamma-D-glutamyl-meso-diaminopimelate ligase